MAILYFYKMLNTIFINNVSLLHAINIINDKNVTQRYLLFNQN